MCVCHPWITPRSLVFFPGAPERRNASAHQSPVALHQTSSSVCVSVSTQTTSQCPSLVSRWVDGNTQLLIYTRKETLYKKLCSVYNIITFLSCSYTVYSSSILHYQCIFSFQMSWNRYWLYLLLLLPCAIWRIKCGQIWIRNDSIYFLFDKGEALQQAFVSVEPYCSKQWG